MHASTFSKTLHQSCVRISVLRIFSVPLNIRSGGEPTLSEFGMQIQVFRMESKQIQVVPHMNLQKLCDIRIKK